MPGLLSGRHPERSRSSGEVKDLARIATLRTISELGDAFHVSFTAKTPAPHPPPAHSISAAPPYPAYKPPAHDLPRSEFPSRPPIPPRPHAPQTPPAAGSPLRSSLPPPAGPPAPCECAATPPDS